MSLHKKRYPHLQTAFGVSDKAGDFSGGTYVTAMLIANVSLKTEGVEFVAQRHSASGEGKGKPDNYTMYSNKVLAQLRKQGGEGSSQCTATAIALGMNMGNIKGQLAVPVLVAQRELAKIEMPNGISRFHERARTGGEASTILAHEYNNIGTGMVLAVTKASAADISTLGNQIAKAMISEEASGSGVQPVIKVPTKEEAQAKKERVAAKVAKAAAPKPQTVWQATVTSGRQQLEREQRETRDTQLLVCGACNKKFMTSKKKAFERHVANCNAPATFQSIKDRAMEELGNVEATLVEEAMVLKNVERTVSFSNAAEFMERLQLRVGNAGALEVVAVTAAHTPATLSLHTYVIPGSVLLKLNGQALPPEATDLAEILSNVGYPASVCFGYPLPAAPQVGWARYVGPTPQVVTTEEQRAYIKSLWVDNEQISAALLAVNMENAPEFAGQEHLHMEPYEIQNFLHRLWDEKKKSAKRTAVNAGQMAEETLEEEGNVGEETLGEETLGMETLGEETSDLEGDGPTEQLFACTDETTS